MSNNVSIYFSPDRVYVTSCKPTNAGLYLTAIDTTTGPIDPEDIENPDNQSHFDELEEILAELAGNDIEKLNVVIPPETSYFSQFPAELDVSRDELQRLLGIEIKQGYPGLTLNDFRPTIIPLKHKPDTKQMMLSILIQNEVIDTISAILSPIGKPINRIEVSQFAANSAFFYNYPERVTQAIAIFGINKEFIDISLLKNGRMMYFNQAVYEGAESAGEMVEREVKSLLDQYVPLIDAAFFHGVELNKDIYMAAWESCMVHQVETGRLNPFRMMNTDMDKRTKEYCSRTSILFPPCIGACLPAYYKTMRVF